MNAQKQAQVYNINKRTFFHLGNRIIVPSKQILKFSFFKHPVIFFMYTIGIKYTTIAKNAFLCL